MRTLIRFVVLAFFVLGFTGTIVGAETETKKEPHCIFHMDAMKNAKYEVTNTPDGVIMKITSDKPEVAKQIQEIVAKCREAHESGDHKHMCPLKKSSESSDHKEQEGKK